MRRNDIGPERKRGVAQKAAGLGEDEIRHAAEGRLLAQACVDFALGLKGDGLVRRECIYGEKPAGVARKTIDGDHLNPCIHGIEQANFFTAREPRAQSMKLSEGLRMIEDMEFIPDLASYVEWDGFEAFLHLLDGRRMQPGGNESLAERTGVATGRDAPEDGRFQECGATTHEGIENDVAGLC